MITVTDAAAAKFKELTQATSHMPRVEITAGGCNGFEKKFSFDVLQNEDIEVHLPNKVVVLIDPNSFKLLENSTIDYKSTLTGSFFTIEIPEAQSSCGCGSSFSL